MSVSSPPPVKRDFHELLRSAMALRRLQVTGSSSLTAFDDAFDEARAWYAARGVSSKEARADRRTLQSVDQWDDVIAIHARGQTSLLEDMVTVLDRIPELRREARAQRVALEQARGLIPGPLEESDQAAWDQLHLYVETKRWQDVVPEGLLPWQRARQRLARLLIDDDGVKEGMRDELQPDTETRERELAAFTEALESHSLGGLGRFDPFDPALAEAVPEEDLRKMKEVIDAATRRAEAIRDLGGTPEEVEGAFGDIPKTWWPPRFVDELQAWRRTQRQLQKEELLKGRYAEDQWFSVKEGILALKAVLSFAGTMAGNVASVQSSVGTIEGGGPTTVAYSGEAFAKDIGAFLSGYTGSLETAASLGEELAKTRPDEWNLEHIHRTLDHTSTAISTLGTTLTQGLALSDAVIKHVTSASDAAKSPFAEMVANGSSLSSSEAAKIVPGLGLGIAILKLANAIRALVEQQQWRFKTLGMQQEEQGRRSDRDSNWETWARGGNLERALGQEVDQRQHNSTIEALNVTSAAFDVAAGAVGVAKVSGLGAPIAAAVEVGILVTKTAVEVAGKVVIANIEFSKMDQARKTLADAKAGSMVAQQLIFLQSPFYAKTYIVILAKDNDPLAARFIIDRGYTGADLEREDVAVSVLREFLMDHARDRDPHDDDAPQSRLGAHTDLIPGGEFVRKTVARKQRYDKANRKHTKAYDAGWTHPGPLLLTKGWWDRAKASAVDAGLMDESSGIGKALKAVASAAAPLEPASGSVGGVRAAVALSGDTLDQADKERKALLQLRGALQAASGVVTDWDALTNPPAPDDDTDPQGGAPHAGMVSTLAEIIMGLQRVLDAVSIQLEDRDLCDPTWGPTGVEDAQLLSAGTWRRVWALAIDKLALDPTDGGVTAAFTAVSSAQSALTEAQSAVDDFSGDRAATNKKWVKKMQALRSARLDAIQRLGGLVKVLMGAPAPWRAFEAWATYLDRIRAAATARSRALDGEAAPQDWAPVGGDSLAIDRVPPDALLAAATWTSIHQQGVAGGIVSADDGDVPKLLGEWEAIHKQMSRVRPDRPLELREKRLEGRRKLVVLKDAVAQFTEDEKATLPPTYLRYCADLINHATKVGDGLRKSMTAVPVTPMTERLTSAAWVAFHDGAVDAGVVNRHSLAGDLKKALAAYEKALSKVVDELGGGGPNARRDARAAVDKALKEAAKVTQKASDLRARAGDGYGEHPAVTQAIDWVVKASGTVGRPSRSSGRC
jgi:hypothetical protein